MSEAIPLNTQTVGTPTTFYTTFHALKTGVYTHPPWNGIRTLKVKQNGRLAGTTVPFEQNHISTMNNLTTNPI